MKRVLLAAVVMLALGGVALVAWPDAMAADKGAAKTPATGPATKPAAPINKFCPVETENPVDVTVPTFVYEGKTIGFCCEDCLPKFKKNPKAFMKDLK